MATVLVVDDANFMRAMLRDILSRGGYDVVGEASNGIEAVSQYKKLRPDAVTMDIIMPEMDGVGAVKAIMEFDPKARIVMCSAVEQQQVLIQAIMAGAREIVAKPFQEKKVIASVQKVLEGK